MSVLVDATVRVSLIILLALGVRIAFGRRSAALRHWVLTLGIACGAAMPVLQFVLPPWNVGMGAFAASAPVQRPPSVATTIAVRIPPAPVRPTTESPAPEETRGSGFPIPQLLVTSWLAGAAMALSVLVVGLSGLSRAASAASPVKAGRLAAIAAEIQGEMRLRRPVTLLLGRDPTLLVTWGAARPKVVLPSDAPQWPEERVRVVLWHEFAHIGRRDWLAQMLAETLRAVYWFNPLLWIACRRLRDESERACDDAVLSAGVGPINYASHLLELARNAARQPRPALGMARSSSLEGRVSAMLNPRTTRHPLRQAARIVTLLAFAAVTVPVAIAQNRFWTLSGTVLDQTDRFVPEATLVLTNGVTGAKHEVKTNRAGHFEFVGLPAGEYQLAVQRPGFQTFQETVSIARDVTRSISLRIGGVRETITVASGGPAGTPPSDAERQAKLERSRQRVQEARQRTPQECSGGATAGDVGGQILPPLKLVDVHPDYPVTLQAAGIGGIVTLDALIGTEGSVRDVKVVSSPHPELERLAIDAVRGWEFSTTYLNCTPIEVPMRVTITFLAR